MLLRAVFLLVGLSAATFSQAQPGSLKAHVDRDHILPGERIILTLEAETPTKGPHVELPSLPDTFQHLEVLRRSEVTTGEEGANTKLSQELTLTGFENGIWTIPALEVATGKSSLHSDSLRITIDAVKLTDSTYHDIRDIVEVPERPFDWKRWGAIALTLLIVVALIWNYLRGRRNRPKPKVTAAERAGAFDTAQKELKALRAEELPGKGQMNAYYTRLYDILRVYLHKQGGHPAMQRTTGELLLRLKPLLPSERTGPLAEALRIADAVKFAKYPSSTDETTASWSAVDETIRTLHLQKPGLDQ